MILAPFLVLSLSFVFLGAREAYIVWQSAEHAGTVGRGTASFSSISSIVFLNFVLVGGLFTYLFLSIHY